MFLVYCDTLKKKYTRFCNLILQIDKFSKLNKDKLRFEIVKKVTKGSSDPFETCKL